jgi:hypothetical protein
MQDIKSLKDEGNKSLSGGGGSGKIKLTSEARSSNWMKNRF